MFKKGFSLVETILVLGFIAVSIGTTLYAYSSISQKSKVNSEIQAMTQLRDNIVSAYAIADKLDFGTSQIIEAGLVPDGLEVRSGRLYGKLSGYTVVGRATAYNGAWSTGTYIRFYHRSINAKDCIALAQKAMPVFDVVLIRSSSDRATNSSNAVTEIDGTTHPDRIPELCNSISRPAVSMKTYMGINNR